MNEMLMAIDECSALGSLPALKEALVRGRDMGLVGLRLFLVYQSDGQVKGAFPQEAGLIFDNCTTQIYLPPASFETAERMSKMIGEYTQVVQSFGTNDGRSWQEGQGSHGHSRGSSMNHSEQGRPLMRPEELLCMDPNKVIIFQRGMSPIFAQRLTWYADSEFNPKVGKKGNFEKWFKIALMIVVGVLFLWAWNK